MTDLTTRSFWAATLERAIKTAAQTAAALIGIETVGLADVAWSVVASGAALAAVLSALTSIGSDAVTGTGPSLASEEIAA